VNTADWKVLVVDDEPDNLGVVNDLLAFYDVTVVSSTSGDQAIVLLDSETFTMALIDIQMPYVSGWDVIKHIREHKRPELRQMLAVGVTAYAMRGDREKVIAAGFDSYISKPIDIDNFMQMLKDIVETYEKQTGFSVTRFQESKD
jgi:CheY-like chemotaxis protein